MSVATEAKLLGQVDCSSIFVPMLFTALAAWAKIPLEDGLDQVIVRGRVDMSVISPQAASDSEQYMRLFFAK